jgi:hypothetical protein
VAGAGSITTSELGLENRKNEDNDGDEYKEK